MSAVAPPRIELHVHLEGTVRPATLLAMMRRNGLRPPAETAEELAALYRFRNLDEFIDVWIMTTNAMRTRDDFRRVVVDYAAQAARHGAVYLEAIFSPAERVMRGVSWEEIFGGYCDGAEEAQATHGVEIRLTPDIHRGAPTEIACEVARQAVAHADRGVVGLGLGGHEKRGTTEDYVRAFAIARAGGLAAVPHAGETAGPPSIRAALDRLGAQRLRHGIRAVEDPALVAELAERRVVLDVCPTSNAATGIVSSLAEHPLPALAAAGVACSISTDDPAMFDTDLSREHELAESLGVTARDAYLAGVAGALCDEATRAQLAAIGATAGWTTADGTPAVAV